MSTYKRISSYILTIIFITVSSLLLMVVGVLGAIAMYKFYTNSIGALTYSIVFILAVVLFYPVYKVLSKISYIWLNENTISVAKVNMLGYNSPTFFPQQEKVYKLKDLQSASSNYFFKNLVSIELTTEGAQKTVKSFLKKGEFLKLKKSINSAP